jgi:hypothetical protein
MISKDKYRKIMSNGKAFAVFVRVMFSVVRILA